MNDSAIDSRPFNKIAIIGLGLIGSSLCRAIRRADLTAVLNGFDANAEHRRIATDLDLADNVTETAADAVAEADLVIMCVPPLAMGDVAEELGPHLKQGAILSDVGSVKASIWRDVSPHVPNGVHFIPGHPVAGTEQSGPKAGFAELFDDRWAILTPQPDTDADALARLTQFWEALGSRVTTMDVEHHDIVLSITSHIPHLIAYNLVATANDLETVTEKEVIKFSAGGFRDFTRIASSDPVMWRDVFLGNRDAVLEMLGSFIEEMTVLKRAIRHGDGDTLFELFSRARDIRKRIIDAGQENPAPDFGRHTEISGEDQKDGEG